MQERTQLENAITICEKLQSDMDENIAMIELAEAEGDTAVLAMRFRMSRKVSPDLKAFPSASMAVANRGDRTMRARTLSRSRREMYRPAFAGRALTAEGVAAVTGCSP